MLELLGCHGGARPDELLEDPIPRRAVGLVPQAKELALAPAAIARHC